MFKDENRHYSLRKLSVGLASVLIGISFVSGNSHTVKADTVKDDSNGAQTVVQTTAKANAEFTPKAQSQTPEIVKKNSDAITQDIRQKAVKASEAIAKVQNNTVKDNSNETTLNAKGSKAIAESTPKEQSQISEVTKKNFGTITQDIRQKAVKASEAVTKVQNNTVKDNSDKTTLNAKGSKAATESMPKEGKTEVKENQGWTDLVKNKLQMSTVRSTTSKRLNAKLLAVSKAVSQANDTNGGFDSSWGKLDVNDWQGQAENGVYELTDYTGDLSHIIVPNEADFEKAGKSTNGLQVGITRDTIHSLVSKNQQQMTIAFSKTNNQKVKAIGTDWSNAFSSNSTLSKFDGSNLDVSNVTDMTYMFNSSQISDLTSLANWDVSNVTDMSGMFQGNSISDLTPLTNWNTGNVTDMSWMFSINKISNLTPLTNWNTSKVTDMYYMFAANPDLIDLRPIANWNLSNVHDQKSDQGRFAYLFAGDTKLDLTNINDTSLMKAFLKDSDTLVDATFITNNADLVKATINKDLPDLTNTAKRTITFNIPNATPKTIVQTINYKAVAPVQVDLDNQQIVQTYPVKESDWQLDTSKQNDDVIIDSVICFKPVKIPHVNGYKAYTVPEIKGLLEPDQTVISRQQADINKPINVTVTYKLVDSNTNDAFALDSKNGLHEHINVNDNGGYDADYWGKLDINDWDYTTNGNVITIIGYKGKNPASLIIPNGADFDFINGQNNSNSRVEISSDVMHDLAKSATRIGLSKTANNKVVASDAIWQDAFGGLTNEPGTDSNANGGIKYGSPNLTQMDLHNLDTATVTNMSALFNGGSNLTTVGDLSDWNTSNVTTMHTMFQGASSLTNIGNLSEWQTGNVTDMSYMFRNVTSLTNIGDLSKWQTGNVADMSCMFANTTNLTNIGNLDNWDTSEVTDMSWMFGTDSSKQSHLTNIGDLSKWQTSNVIDMHDMFANATNLTNIGDLSKWQTGNVTDMSYMFNNATSLTNIGNLDNWDTNEVTNMSWMFGTDSSKQSHLTNIGDLSKWQTGNVTDMSYMFNNATSLTNIGDLSKWQTGNVTNMFRMFTDATNLTNIGDLSKWQTGNVTDMSYMFMNAKALHNLNISNWNLTNLPDKNAMKYMFANDANLTVIANDLKLPTWYQNEINDADYFWNNHMAVITNVPELIRATGDINNLKIDDQDASRSIFYDSKGSSDAIQVLKDANQAYISKYEQDHPKYLLALDASVDQTNPIALANAKFKTSHKLIDVVQTDHATRTIIVHLPNGTTQTIVQTIGLKRNAQQDLVTEIISSTAPWGLDEANSSYTIDGIKQAQTAYKPNSNIITFSSIKLPKVPGYKAKVIRNNGLLLVSYLALAPEKPVTNNNLNELQFSNKLATNSTVKSNIVVKSDMYQVANDDHNWQLPVIKSYDLKAVANNNQIIFAYTKDKQYNYRFVLTFKDGQYRLTTFDKQNKLLKTYSIESYKKLAEIIHSLVSMNIA